MNILLTGVSSFTGAWFARALAEAGHQVLGTLRSPIAAYDGLRQARLDWARAAGVSFLEGCAFGDPAFLEALAEADLLCHHGAEVRNYQSLDFDVLQAVAANTANVRQVFERCAQKGLLGVVATGSVFEPDEGLGDTPLRAFSPYGLSKGMSWQVQKFWAEKLGIALGKFVIPNPFGPYEEARFCAHLMRHWVRGEAAEVRTPAYVRDNIPVDLLTARYAAYVAQFAKGGPPGRCAPSGYVETQGRFAERFGKEVAGRLGLTPALHLADQTEFPEPLMRVNPAMVPKDWDEAASWDRAADYYRAAYLA